MTSSWKAANVAGKIGLLRPLLAQRFTLKRIADRLGTTSGAVAGFIHYHPEVREAGERAYFGDGVTSARVAVRIKGLKSPEPSPPEPSPPSPPVSPAGEDAPTFQPRQRRRRFAGATGLQDALPEQAPATIEPAPAVVPAIPGADQDDVAEDRPIVPQPAALHHRDTADRPQPGGKVLLIDAGMFRCKFPDWPNGAAPAAGEQFVCGDVVSPGRIYCERHCRLAYPRLAEASS